MKSLRLTAGPAALVLAVLAAVPVFAVARQGSADSFFAGGSRADRARDKVALEIVTKLNASTIDARFNELYAPAVVFVDPLGKVDGRDALKAHFKGYYDQITLENAKVVDVVRDGSTRVVVWEITSQLKIGGNPIGKSFTYKGNSLLKFDCDEKVVFHRDTFDQLPLYQQIPGFDATLSGILFQYIGEQLGAPPAAPPVAP